MKKQRGALRGYPPLEGVASNSVRAQGETSPSSIKFMTLQQIKYILGVADSGSFNKASEKLFISQPSLTSSVHDAEGELGFQVFNRSARGVTVTERGQSFINDARELYKKYEELLKKHSGSEKKTFSVSTLY
ncbi:MAG: LysR family transcriptional regulator, partial [Treponema sp.]|nr:LysR family transcriptional regulator [Treponema sp.]